MLLNTSDEFNSLDPKIAFNKKNRIDGGIAYLTIGFFVIACFALIVVGLGRVQKISDEAISTPDNTVVERPAEIHEEITK